MFSVVLPSWNSLEYLKILYGSLKRNTKVRYELIVHDNASTDDTLAWLKENNIKHTRSEENEGYSAINHAVEKASYPYIVLVNSDHYMLPGWDIEIVKNINKFKQSNISKFLLSLCVIEPDGYNPECVIHDCGCDSKAFNEEELLRYYFIKCGKRDKIDTNQYSQPSCLSRALWDEIGGMDVDYFPGWAIDHDFVARLYRAGCRNFLLIGKAKTYHFSSKTFSKLPKEIKDKHGQDIFLKKWGVAADEMRKRFKIARAYEQLSEGLL